MASAKDKECGVNCTANNQYKKIHWHIKTTPNCLYDYCCM